MWACKQKVSSLFLLTPFTGVKLLKATFNEGSEGEKVEKHKIESSWVENDFKLKWLPANLKLFWLFFFFALIELKLEKVI